MGSKRAGEEIDELGRTHRSVHYGAYSRCRWCHHSADTYWPAVQKILDERDILFISDEVICGFGRTGNLFGFQTYGTKPDLITFAKAVTNGYMLLAEASLAQSGRCLAGPWR